jgi:phosphoribosyl-AMP cyclohydrolase
MFAYMNGEALSRTLETGEAHFWSRSRGRLWRKGEESGNTMRVVELRTDCDQDALWLKVEIGGKGVGCHTRRRSCFYRAVPLGGGPAAGVTLRFVDAERASEASRA